MVVDIGFGVGLKWGLNCGFEVEVGVGVVDGYRFEVQI